MFPLHFYKVFHKNANCGFDFQPMLCGSLVVMKTPGCFSTSRSMASWMHQSDGSLKLLDVFATADGLLILWILAFGVSMNQLKMVLNLFFVDSLSSTWMTCLAVETPTLRPTRKPKLPWNNLLTSEPGKRTNPLNTVVPKWPEMTMAPGMFPMNNTSRKSCPWTSRKVVKATNPSVTRNTQLFVDYLEVCNGLQSNLHHTSRQAPLFWAGKWALDFLQPWSRPTSFFGFLQDQQRCPSEVSSIGAHSWTSTDLHVWCCPWS